MNNALSNGNPTWQNNRPRLITNLEYFSDNDFKSDTNVYVVCIVRMLGNDVNPGAMILQMLNVKEIG